jgi:hypothetical protein
VLLVAASVGCGDDSAGRSVFGTEGGSTTRTSDETTTGTHDATASADATDGSATDDDGSVCIDADGDGYGENCPAGPDCDDDNPAVWTEEGCANCADADGDSWWAGCDAYPDMDGPDCDDSDACVWTEEGCANCIDADGDGWWVGCDVFGSCGKLGPDCDDDNPEVTGDDTVELCDGIAQNCAGLIDPYPAADMCPAPGETDPTVDQWICDPPEPGVDGCTIGQCAPELHDVDQDLSNGCECEAMPISTVGTACDDPIDLGDLTDDEATVVTHSGNVLPLDRSVWYRIRGVDVADNSCDQYHVRVRFLENPGDQYAFEVRRGSCDGIPTAGQPNGGAPAGSIDYTWATDFRAVIQGRLSGECPCTAPAATQQTSISVCSNDTAEYFLRVSRDPELEEAPTCEPYVLEFSNGLYSWGSY